MKPSQKSIAQRLYYTFYCKTKADRKCRLLSADLTRSLLQESTLLAASCPIQPSFIYCLIKLIIQLAINLSAFFQTSTLLSPKIEPVSGGFLLTSPSKRQSKALTATPARHAVPAQAESSCQRYFGVRREGDANLRPIFFCVLLISKEGNNLIIFFSLSIPHVRVLRMAPISQGSYRQEKSSLRPSPTDS